jgi:tetratricopeptide (TPR) repeat protein
MTLRLTGLLLLLLLLAACASSPAGQPRHDAKTHYLLGATALAENNPTLALQEFLLAEQVDRRDADIQAGLAQAYMEKRAYELAEKHLLKAISLSKGAPQHYQNLGALYLSMERYDDAIVVFRKVAANLLFATPEVAWAGIGFAHFRQQDYAAAEQAYRKALELNSRYAQAMYRLGELYYAQDRTVEAAEAFARATEINPRSVDANYWLGLTAMKVGDTPRARQAFTDTIRLAPDSEQARLARGYLKTLP